MSRMKPIRVNLLLRMKIVTTWIARTWSSRYCYRQSRSWLPAIVSSTVEGVVSRVFNLIYNSWGLIHCSTASIWHLTSTKVPSEVHFGVLLLLKRACVATRVLLIKFIEVKSFPGLCFGERCVIIWNTPAIELFLSLGILQVYIFSSFNFIFVCIPVISVKWPFFLKDVKPEVSSSRCNIPLLIKFFLLCLFKLFSKLKYVFLSAFSINLAFFDSFHEHFKLLLDGLFLLLYRFWHNFHVILESFFQLFYFYVTMLLIWIEVLLGSWQL